MATPADYTDVFERLERDEVRYVAISGVAVVLHGHLRPVADLDIAIDPFPIEAQRAMATLMAAGFAPTLPLPLSMLTVLRMFDGSGREIDVFVRYQIPFDELFRESEQVRLGDTTVRVASLHHVIQVKRARSRPDDLQDVQNLLGAARPGS